MDDNTVVASMFIALALFGLFVISAKRNLRRAALGLRLERKAHNETQSILNRCVRTAREHVPRCAIDPDCADQHEVVESALICLANSIAKQPRIIPHAKLFQAGHLTEFSKDDPEFFDYPSALTRAIQVSKTAPDSPLGVWTGQRDGSELLSVIVNGQIFYG